MGADSSLLSVEHFSCAHFFSILFLTIDFLFNSRIVRSHHEEAVLNGRNSNITRFEVWVVAPGSLEVSSSTCREAVKVGDLL